MHHCPLHSERGGLWRRLHQPPANQLARNQFIVHALREALEDGEPWSWKLETAIKSFEWINQSGMAFVIVMITHMVLFLTSSQVDNWLLKTRTRLYFCSICSERT